MIKSVGLLFSCIWLAGCMTDNYGYSASEWNSFTQAEKEEIKAQSQEELRKVKEEERRDKFLNTPINKTFGSRSNVF